MLPTFETYLNAEVGDSLNCTFNVVPFYNMPRAFQAVEANGIDLLYISNTMQACFEVRCFNPQKLRDIHC